MKRCPRCHRFGIDEGEIPTKCLWKDCGHIVRTFEEVENAKHPFKFKKFMRAIKRKKSICD